METISYTLPSFAKINWFLRVLGKREDGYHEICTAFQTVSLADELVFEEDNELVLTCNEKELPTNEDNLIIKAANLLLERFQINKGARIELKKKIPLPGGLGGGSSNAAVALLGLSKLWKLPVDLKELVEIGSSIGSDVPFFFYGGTALGFGRGTEISILEDINRKFMVIATPNVAISTRDAYLKLGVPSLTKSASKSILQNCYEDVQRLNSKRLVSINDFENSIFAIKPEIKNVKEKLLDLGAANAMMSGSGASVFGVFDNEENRQMALRGLEGEQNLRSFAVNTISRQDYRKFFKPCNDLLSESF